jgi:hypothetical protein
MPPSAVIFHLEREAGIWIPVRVRHRLERQLVGGDVRHRHKLARRHRRPITP